MFKTVLKVTGIVLVLLIVALAVLPMLYKDKIIALVKDEANKNINAKLDFGDFDLSIFRSFPDFTFTLNNLSVAGIKEFEGDTLAYIQQLYVNVDVMSVIKGDKIKIKAIKLDHPRIYAHVLKDGKANWDIAKPSIDTITKQEKPSEPAKFKLGLKRFAILNANIIYKDEKGGTFAQLTNFTHELKGDFTQDIFLIKTELSADELTVAQGAVKYLNKVKMVMKLEVDADMPNMKFTLKDNTVSLNELELGWEGYVAAKQDLEMDLKFGAKKTDFKNFLSLIPAVYSKDFKDLKTSGKLGFDGYVKGKKTEKTIPAFGLKLIIENGMFQYPSLPTAVNNVQVNLAVSNPDGVLDNTVVDLSKLHLEIGKEPFDAKVFVKTPISDPDVNAELIGKIDLANVSKIVPLEQGTTLSGLVNVNLTAAGKMSSIKAKKYEEFKAAGQLSITSLKYAAKAMPKGIDMPALVLTFTPQIVKLENLEARMGNSDFKMDGQLENFIPFALKGETVVGKLNFSSNKLDLNEFASSDANAEAKKPADPAKPDTASMKVIEVPANIDFVLTTKVGKILFSNMDMSDVKGAVIVKDGTVSMQGLSMNMLDGNMNVNGSYSTADIKKPVISFDLAISNFDVQKTVTTFGTVKKMAAIAEKAHGKYSTKLKFSANLDAKMSPVLNTLNGAGTLNTQNITVDGFEALNKLGDAIKSDKYKKLELRNTNITFKFENGRVTVQPFDIAIGGAKAKLGGSSGFDQTIDYIMNIDVPRKELGSAANAIVDGLTAQLAAKTGVNANLGDIIKMDALIGGTASKPTVKLAMRGSEGGKSISDDLKDKAKAEVERLKAEAEAKIKAETDKLKAEADKKKVELEAKGKAEANKLKAEAEAKAKAEADKAKKAAEEKAKKAAEQKAKDAAKKFFP